MKGDSRRGIADLDHAKQLDPKNPETYRGSALALCAVGQDGNAIADFNEAIRLDPKDAGTYLNRAVAWMESPSWSLTKAVADCNAAIQLDANNPNA